MYEVYVKLDANGIIIDINSSAFIKNYDGWVKIDQGDTALYARAQVEYLEKGLVDENGRFNYKLSENNVVALTDEEKTILYPYEEKLSEFEQLGQMITELELMLLEKTG